ncbi:hypothetical protein DM558_00565 [Entomomonas moraniae]|uniref:Uncharacterized protein n=1 Tax=Entomomonas moraniae TaxID=2213226 RepID=A0A3S9XAP8_9GAMM|nr:hypothetical protein [Entomomonas moraniae]AZS49361.1 hypothetical protein DM558_00565 [Entomomonas moraniae]
MQVVLIVVISLFIAVFCYRKKINFLDIKSQKEFSGLIKKNYFFFWWLALVGGIIIVLNGVFEYTLTGILGNSVTGEKAIKVGLFILGIAFILGLVTFTYRFQKK